VTKPPYPWPKAIMLSRAQAPKLYELDEQRILLRRKMAEELEKHIEGERWSHVMPYLLFCELEGVDIETSIAACLGYLRHVIEGDLQHGLHSRESLAGLRLPKEPAE